MATLIEGELRWFGKVLDPDFTQLRLLIISDAHYGNPLFSMKYWSHTLKFVNDNPDVYCLVNGDICESTIKTSKGEIFKQVGTPQDQRDWAIEQFYPIRDKILGMTKGNHEDRIWQEVGVDICKDIAQALGVPYRAEGMMVKIIFGDGNNRMKGMPYVFWGYITHGYGGARTKAAKAVKVERLGAWIPRCDWVAMSHDHVVNIAPDVDFLPDNRGILNKETGFLSGKITAHRKLLIKTNAYLKWGGYSEFGGFPPVDMVSPVIYLLTPKSEFWANNMAPGVPKKMVRVIA